MQQWATRSIYCQRYGTEGGQWRQYMLLLVVLYLCYATTAVPGRDLLATTYCDQPIPKCRPRMCIMKKFAVSEAPRPYCQRCESTYISMNNGQACVCEAGKYDTGSSCQSCGEGYYCPGIKNTSYIARPGDHAAARGPRIPCDKKYANGTNELTPDQMAVSGLKTGKIRATEWTECVPKPGYRLASTTPGNSHLTEATQTAMPCFANTYSPGGKRLTACLPCPRGLVTVGDLPSHHDAANDCKVPPGYYYDRGVGIACPKGTYRQDFSDQYSSEPCTPCGAGISTEKAGSASRSACRVVEPGYMAEWNPDEGGYAYNTNTCPEGSYWPGGIVTNETIAQSGHWTSCLSCNGYTTRQAGSTKLSDCVAPPGHYVPPSTHQAGVNLIPCPTSITGQEYGLPETLWEAYGTFGTYRPGWATTPNGVRDCQICGANMLSERTEYVWYIPGWQELGATGPLSCYIDQDWSLTKDYTLDATYSTWRAAPCPTYPDTIGAKEKTYGLLAAIVCKPVTSLCGQGFVYNRTNDNCVNPAGWGAYERQAIECSAGTWAAEGSMEECKSCGDGRSTVEGGDPTSRDSVTDCFVLPGYGVINSNPAMNETGRWFEAGAYGLLPQTAENQAKLEVVECPVGRYSTSTGSPNDIAARCLACPYKSTTADTGSTSIKNCTYCMEGYGKFSDEPAQNSCHLCMRGTYNDASSFDPVTGAERASASCLVCTSYQYAYPYATQLIAMGHLSARIMPVDSNFTTYRPGATSESECLPASYQLSFFAGTTVFDETYLRSVWYTSQGWHRNLGWLDIGSCVAACWKQPFCHFAEYRYNDGAEGCYLFIPDENSFPVMAGKVWYKIPMLGDNRVASIKAQTMDAPSTSSNQDAKVNVKTISSGLYAQYNYPLAVVRWGPQIGSYATLGSAASACDAMADCWGVTQDFEEAAYIIRTGSDPAATTGNENGTSPLYVRTVISAAKSYEDLSSPSTIIVQPGKPPISNVTTPPQNSPPPKSSPPPGYGNECGTGLGSNTTDNVSIPTQVTCMPCERGTYSDGSYFFPATTQVRTNSQCLACPTRDYPYRYAGEVSALGYSPESFRPVGSGRTTYRPGAESQSECVPVLYQLSSMVGTSVLSAAYLRRFLERPAYPLFGVPIIDGELCAQSCSWSDGSDNRPCHFTQYHFNATWSCCHIFTPKAGYGQVWYKLPAITDNHVASIGSESLAAVAVHNTDALVGAQSVGLQKYVRYTYDPYDAEAPEWGPALAFYMTVQNAASDCSLMEECWGITHDYEGAAYITRTGTDLAAGGNGTGPLFVRTVISAAKMSERLDTLSPYIMQIG